LLSLPKTKHQAPIKQLQKEVYAPYFTDIVIDWIFKTKESLMDEKNLVVFDLMPFITGKNCDDFSQFKKIIL
jgi:hypothetical protein